jgi:tRNA(Arg) A34 adenosine deaminase TadA
MTEAEWMQQAIAIARTGVDNGQSPFGAVIVNGSGEAIAVAHNTVWLTCDPTAHAEVNAIRKATLHLRDISLAGTVMYTTCEPCPMCLTAIHWAKIERVVFGATIADAESAGFAELDFSAKELAEKGGSPLIVESGLLQAECAALFAYWKQANKCQAY